MSTARLDRILAEYAQLREADADPVLAAVRTAIFVEDAFGVTLSDDQIDPAVLADANALRALLTGATSPL